MSTLTIRRLEEETKALLRVQAAYHARSMEAEARDILRQALAPRSADTGLGSRIHARFAAVGVREFQLPSRSDMPRAAEFEA